MLLSVILFTFTFKLTIEEPDPLSLNKIKALNE